MTLRALQQTHLSSNRLGSVCKMKTLTRRSITPTLTRLSKSRVWMTKKMRQMTTTMMKKRVESKTKAFSTPVDFTVKIPNCLLNQFLSPRKVRSQHPNPKRSTRPNGFTKNGTRSSRLPTILTCPSVLVACLRTLVKRFAPRK